MTRAIYLSASFFALSACALAAQTPWLFHDRHLETLPSGDTALVLRFLDPDLATQSYADVAPRLDALCDGQGREEWRALEDVPDELVLVVMDRAVPRGTADPQSTQYISAYRIDDVEGCIWQ